MIEENARKSILLLTQRVRAMGQLGVACTSVDPQSGPPKNQAEALAELTIELDRLDVRCGPGQVEEKRRASELDKLQTANRLGTVGTLTAGLAHEFGTPLGVVLARAQMIADESDMIEAHKDATEIIRQVKRLTQMCREVLDYARPKAPAGGLIDVVQIVRQMVTLLQIDARKRNAVLTFIDHKPVMINGDRYAIMQIFSNLIINATQAMPKGGAVIVSIEQKSLRPPDAENLPEGEYICIHVKDSGLGIQSEDLANVFEAFYSTRMNQEGTGIGLTVSQRIARQHKGWIGVASKAGDGSLFTVGFPVEKNHHVELAK